MHAFTSHKTFWSFVLLAVLAVCSNGCDSDVSNSTSPTLTPSASGWDQSPPAAPSGLEVNYASGDVFKLTWTANTEEDLAGYKVYVYSPSPYRTNSYICLQGGSMIPADQSWCTYSGDTSPGTHYFWVTAVDGEGNESFGGIPLEFHFDGSDDPPAASDRAGGTSTGEAPQWGEPTGPSSNPHHQAEDKVNL